MYVHDAMVELWNIYYDTRIVSADDCAKDGSDQNEPIEMIIILNRSK